MTNLHNLYLSGKYSLMKHFYLLFLLCPMMVWAQLPELQPLSNADSIALMRLPEFKPNDGVLRRLIPYAVDNSTLPWFRPLIAQVGLECGQSSSIGIVLTYELNALRQVQGTLPQNQYATHFTYNFINGGSDAGINSIETYEIIKKAGNPNVIDYGGMAAGGPSRWLNGYNLYYNSMHNRIKNAYTIKVNTPEGIQALKQWIFDHADGSSAGGLASFYAQFTSPPITLVSGTPEAGKFVITTWGAYPNHSMAICGYNDSIRWDYNGDGQYTNHLDINMDGVIDARDWEIGGFKMANTYGSINYWGDEGFAYMMYKSVADLSGQGGIWNNTVIIVDAIDNYEPSLTAKVSLLHNCRNKLRVSVGVANDIQADTPEYILNFPIFDFQGGCNPMQGTGYPEQIEFGLDLNPLLEFTQTGVEARFFLMIDESDPLSQAQGALLAFSLMDYSSGVANEIVCPINEIPLVDNGLTLVPLNAAISFNAPAILTDTLSPAIFYSNYSTQLEATAGTPPLSWNLYAEYEMLDSTANMPLFDEFKLSVSNNNSGNAEVTLPFDFPYFDEMHQKVYATSDGSIMFENTLLPWPFYVAGRTYFLQNAMIAPCMSHPFLIDASKGDGIWYQENEEFVTFRWKLSIYGMELASVNFTARLFRNGRIEFNYGTFDAPSYLVRFAGISAGNGFEYKLLSTKSDFTPYPDQLSCFMPARQHTGLQISSDGLLSGKLSPESGQSVVSVRATDKYGLVDKKIFVIEQQGLLMSAQIMAGYDQIIGFGDTCLVNLKIKNLNPFTVENCLLKLSTLNQKINISSSQTTLNQLLPGDSIWIENAFEFIVGNNVSNGQPLNFLLKATSDDNIWMRNLAYNAYRPEINVHKVEVLDGNNGLLQAGENALLLVEYINVGGIDLLDAEAMVTSWDPYLSIAGMHPVKDTLHPGQVWGTTFMLSLSPETPSGHELLLNLHIAGQHDFAFLQTIMLLTNVLAENFETGNFNNFGWEHSGHAGWFVEDGNSWEGNNNARSGEITHDQWSALSFRWNVAYSDSLTFYYSVISETNYDFLKVYSDDHQLARWSGVIPWKRAALPVDAGEHLFSFKYTKDYSVSNGEDCARLDYIVMPPYAVPTAVNGKMKSLSAIEVYPNPTAENFTIKLAVEKTSLAELFITDMYGRVIWQHREIMTVGTHILKPDVHLAAPGTYLIVLKNSEGLLVRKLIRSY